MICDECGIRPATIRLMTIVNGEKAARNLCVRCMTDMKKQLPNLDLSGLDSMLANLLAATKKAGVQSDPEIDITCEHCGTTYAEFQKTGLLGCAECYNAFREPLSELLKRIHGQSQHTGHVPGAAPASVPSKLSIYGLKQQLSQAIADEAYERAAELRDKIRVLTAEAEMKGAGVHDGP